MEKADLVIFTEKSGAVIETLFANKPLLWLSYLCPPKDDDLFSYNFFKEYCSQVDSSSKLLEIINQRVNSKSVLKEVIKKQEEALPKVLSSTGIIAAEKLAIACETLIQNKIV